MAYGSIATITYASRTNTTLTPPSSLADDDILFLVMFLFGSGVTPTPPTGFTAVGAPWPFTYAQDSGQGKAYAWWKRASGESGSYILTHATASTQAALVRLTGRITSGNPIEAFSGSNSGATQDTSGTAPGITTLTNDADIIGVEMGYANISGATPPGGTTPTFTEQFDSTILQIATGTLATAGATGDKTWTTVASADTAGLFAFTSDGAPPPPTVPTLVGAGTASFTATNAANLTPTLPTGWAPDDVHVLLAARSENATAMTALSGWTQIAALSGANGAAAHRVEVWLRRAQAGDGTPTVTFGSGTIVRGARIYGIRDVPNTGTVESQIDASSRLNTASSTTVSFTDITTTADNSFVLALGAYEDDPTTVSTLTGYTQPAGAVSGSTLGNDMMLFYQHKLQTTAGTPGGGNAATSGGTATASPNVGILIAFKAPSTGPTGTGAVTLGVPALGGVGVLSYQGAGGSTLRGVVLAGTGTHIPPPISGTGAVALREPVLSGVGQLGYVGTGAVALQAPVLGGIGQLAYIGVGAVALGVPTLGGTGLYTIQSISGTGGVLLSTVHVSSLGQLDYAGAGAVLLDVPQLAGIGVLEYVGVGTVVLAVPALGGTGILAYTGSGGITIRVPVLSGSSGVDFTTALSYYLKMDEASGSALDAHGSLNFTDVNTVGTASGIINGARDFEADNGEYLTRVHHASFSMADNSQLRLWARIESKGDTRILMGKWGGEGAYEYLLYYDTGSDRYALTVSVDGSSSNLATVVANNFGSPSLGTWDHITAWHDATNDQIGIAVNNGTPNVLSHATGIFSGTADLRIGVNQGNAGNFWDGQIDEVGQWQRVFSAGERTADYNGGAGRGYPAAGAVTGTGGILIGMPIFGGTGVLGYAGAGGAVLTVPVLSGTGQLAYVGVGGILLRVPTMVGTGLYTPQPVSGTGAIALGMVQLAGTSQLGYAGVGAVSLRVIQLAGTGVLAYTGVGTIVLRVPASAGVGQLVYAGTGAATLGRIQLSGTGQLGYVGTGGVSLLVPQLAGSGVLAYTGMGAVVLTVPTLAGIGQLGYGGVGAVTLGVVQLGGLGSFIGAAGGVGSVVLLVPQLGGIGILSYVGIGGVAVPRTLLSGSGITIDLISGVGGAVLGVPTLGGIGVLGYAGLGGALLGVVMLGGAGTVVAPGTGFGGVLLSVPMLGGMGQLGYTGAGGASLWAPVLGGVGTFVPLPITGAGGVVLGVAVLGGIGEFSVSGSGGVLLSRVQLAGIGALASMGYGGILLSTVVLSGSGTYVPELVTGAGGVVLDALIAGGIGTFVAAPIVGSGGVVLGLVVFGGIGTAIGLMPHVVGPRTVILVGIDNVAVTGSDRRVVIIETGGRVVL